ncbi:MAG: hypothetical protein ACI8ZB_005526 [Desulforhopalus sp.]|jgi:hypothetical protein
MSNYIKAVKKACKRKMTRTQEINMRKHLNGDALLNTMRTGFAGIRDHRLGTVTHSLSNSLMAGFAVFSLKDPSLLAFDERRFRGPHNLMTIYGMDSIPCDRSGTFSMGSIQTTYDHFFKMRLGNSNGVKYLKNMYLWKEVIY